MAYIRAEIEYKVFYRDEVKVIEVDINKAQYQGIPWKQCSEFQKRKYENFIVLANNTREPIKLIYQ